MNVIRSISWWDKLVLHLVLLIPFVELVVQVVSFAQGGSHRLGADPGKFIVDELANYGLWLLLITLAVTPVRRLLKWNRVQRYRRMLGLYCFGYITLHLLAYLAFLLAWDFANLIEDVVKRPYIIFGALAWLGLLLLAATSFNRAMRILKKNWARLHKLIYPVAILAVVHEWWQAKEALSEPALHGLILAILLGIRLFYWLKKKQIAFA